MTSKSQLAILVMSPSWILAEVILYYTPREFLSIDCVLRDDEHPPIDLVVQ
jgi:hypothetical protein